MISIPDFEKRLMASEQLDQTDLGGPSLEKTLAELEQINHYLGNHRQLIKAVIKHLPIDKEEAITIIDLGCGGGDVLRKLEAALRRKQIAARLIGLDANAHILNYAASQSTHSLIEYRQADLLADDFELPQCDILICSHFLYHFTDQQLQTFLRRQQYQVSSCFLFSELQRSRMAWFLFRIIAKIVRFSPMTSSDGLLAIRRAFRKVELEQNFRKAGFRRYKIQWKWAFRYLIELYPER